MSVAESRRPLTERGQRTRDALLVAAREVFEDRGYSATRMGDISKRAGVSHGTSYVYFADKEELLRELVERIVDEVFTAAKVSDTATDPFERIEEGNRRYLDVYARNARMLEVVEEVATSDGYYRDVLGRVRAAFTRRAAEGIKRLQKAGLADRTVDADAAAPLLCGMVENLAQRQATNAGSTTAGSKDVATLTTLWANAIGLTGSER